MPISWKICNFEPKYMSILGPSPSATSGSKFQKKRRAACHMRQYGLDDGPGSRLSDFFMIYS